MKYIRLFENFEEGHKFDILDLFTITPSEVKKLFFKELDRNNPDMENIQVFLESGLVDVNTKDDQNRTPLNIFFSKWVSLTPDAERAARASRMQPVSLIRFACRQAASNDDQSVTPGQP